MKLSLYRYNIHHLAIHKHQSASTKQEAFDASRQIMKESDFVGCENLFVIKENKLTHSTACWYFYEKDRDEFVDSGKPHQFIQDALKRMRIAQRKHDLKMLWLRLRIMADTFYVYLPIPLMVVLGIFSVLLLAITNPTMTMVELSNGELERKITEQQVKILPYAFCMSAVLYSLAIRAIYLALA